MKITLSLLSLGFVISVIPYGLAQLQLGGFGVGGVGDVLTCAQQFQQASQYPNPDIGLNIEQYVTKYGYPIEKHTVTTKDGYILNVFRMPYSPRSLPVEGVKKKAVYLNHGLGGTGQQWILANGLGFLLSDLGYDVFLGNARGTSYSPGHVNLTQNDNAYWDFSWHEMAVYDVPAVIDMILSVTETQKLYYVGHSMGTTQFFIAMSQPELQAYNDKIYTGFMLAPIAYIPHATNAVRLLAPLGYNAQYLTAPVLGGKIDASESLKNMTGLSLGTLCSPSALACAACSNALFLLDGYDGPQMNYAGLSLFLSVFPDVVSTKCLVHYAQSMDSAKFRQFDYGSSAANERRYGSGNVSPPEYDLSRIRCPVVFMNALNDNLGVPQDVATTAGKMNQDALKERYTVPWNLFTHLDFAIAKDVRPLVYNKVASIMTAGTYE